ncbi:hypothetical protein SDC9_96238 [bioreactor metagenome]|uniref:Uncharacterized protein n=1 Tax=bioreactor metagenome TaxID=1076179 RepID=A0A645A9X6_9ZZZZ
MTAVSLVCASSRQMAGEQAAPAVCHAHGPVHEDLKLKVGIGILDATDVVQGSLPSQDNPGKAHPMVHAGTG